METSVDSVANKFEAQIESRIIDKSPNFFILVKNMRITSGIARGISLESPKGDSTRPATDAARQAIFSSLGEYIANAVALDLFAGTGSYGLEAASRGAREIYFVENDRRAFECLKKNISNVSKSLRYANTNVKLSAISADCARATKTLEGKKFDIVFADPPYHLLLEEKSLTEIFLTLSAFSSEETIFVLEAPADFESPTETSDGKFLINVFKRLGKKSKGKPSQLIFNFEKR